MFVRLISVSIVGLETSINDASGKLRFWPFSQHRRTLWVAVIATDSGTRYQSEEATGGSLSSEGLSWQLNTVRSTSRSLVQDHEGASGES